MEKQALKLFLVHLDEHHRIHNLTHIIIKSENRPTATEVEFVFYKNLGSTGLVDIETIVEVTEKETRGKGYKIFELLPAKT